MTDDDTTPAPSPSTGESQVDPAPTPIEPAPASAAAATGPLPGTWTHRFEGGPLDGRGFSAADDDAPETVQDGPEGVTYVLDGHTYRPRD